jgi:hypothetical protein
MPDDIGAAPIVSCLLPPVGPLVARRGPILGTRGFWPDAARQQLAVAIEWGRYGALFEYDSDPGLLVLGSDPARAGI